MGCMFTKIFANFTQSSELDLNQQINVIEEEIQNSRSQIMSISVRKTLQSLARKLRLIYNIIKNDRTEPTDSTSEDCQSNSTIDMSSLDEALNDINNKDSNNNKSFQYKLHSFTPSSDIEAISNCFKQELELNLIKIEELNQNNKSVSWNKSFHIIVSDTNRETIRNPANWPRNIRIGKYWLEKVYDEKASTFN